MTLLIDASVWVAAIDEDDPDSSACRDLVRTAGISRATLDLACLEVMNVVARRHGSDLAKSAIRFIRRSTRGRTMTLADSELDHLAELVSATRLSSYDGSYVVVAASRGWKLVSLDIRDLVGPGWAITPTAALGGQTAG